MGKKYVIEVADDSFYDDLSTKCWRVKGIDGLILDEDDLSNLEEYKEHKFVPGDIVMFKGASQEAILTYVSIRGMGPIYYMFSDGSCNKVFSSEELIFIRHEDCLKNFLDNGGCYS